MSKVWSISLFATKVSRESWFFPSASSSQADEAFEFYSEDRVRKGADKLKARLSSKQQGRLDGFFTVQPKDPKAGGTKRKVSRSSSRIVSSKVVLKDSSSCQADDKGGKGKKAKTETKGKGKKK